MEYIDVIYHSDQFLELNSKIASGESCDHAINGIY